jgi:hypothetical protein
MFYEHRNLLFQRSVKLFKLEEGRIRALFTEIPLAGAYHVSILAQRNHAATLGASGWFIFWGVLQRLEIVLIRPEIHVHLCLEAFPAQRAVFPVPRMIFVVMIAAERIMTVVPVTAVSRIREQDVLILIVTDPVVTTFRFRQLPCLAAQAAPRAVFAALLDGRFPSLGLSPGHLLPPPK